MKIFLNVVKWTSLPLVILVFVFSDSSKWKWISISAQVILFSYGLVGGIAGFIKYGIQRNVVPMPAWMPNAKSSPHSLNKDRNSNHVLKWVVVTGCVFLSMAALCVIIILDNK
jgi:hypothetical protein